MTVAATVHTPAWSGVTTTWRAHASMGARFGSALHVALPPGSSYPVHSHHAVERVVYVVKGAATHSGDGGATPIAVDDVLVLPPGSWHGVTNTGELPCEVWIMYSPVTDFPVDDYREIGSDDQPSTELIKQTLRGTADDPDISVPEKGFNKMSVIWDGARGAENITLGLAYFGEAGHHRWHRHPRADELIYVVTGRSHHLTDSGDVVLTDDTYEFSPANEWHTMPVDAPTECIFAYFGAHDLESTGYERRDNL